MNEIVLATRSRDREKRAHGHKYVTEERRGAFTVFCASESRPRDGHASVGGDVDHCG